MKSLNPDTFFVLPGCIAKDPLCASLSLDFFNLSSLGTQT